MKIDKEQPNVIDATDIFKSKKHPGLSDAAIMIIAQAAGRSIESLEQYSTDHQDATKSPSD